MPVSHQLTDELQRTTLVGTQVSHYAIDRLLGRGGMSSVYLAIDSRTGVEVAMKILLHDLAGEPKYLERFQREAQALSALNHRNVVQILDLVVLPDGRPGIVQELLTGPTLADWLVTEGTVSLSLLAALLVPVCEAASLFHDAGIVHRDLKPENLVFPDSTAQPSAIKIVDFGVARMTESNASKLTGKNILGTPEYIAPEIIEGATADGRADIYSLGVIAYQMLTGTTPFRGPTVGAILLQHLSKTPAPPSSLRPDLGADVDEVVLRAIAKQPADRYVDGRTFARDLETLVPEVDPGPIAAG